MQLDPQWIVAICAVLTLLILWSSTIIGVAVWIMRRLDGNKNEILADIAIKHAENRTRVDAMQQMLIRHDTLLDPEYGVGNGKTIRRGQ